MTNDNDLQVPPDAYAEFAEFRARTNLSEREAAALAVRVAREAQEKNGVPDAHDLRWRAVRNASATAFWILLALWSARTIVSADVVPLTVPAWLPAPTDVLSPAVVLVLLVALVATLREVGVLPSIRAGGGRGPF